MTDLPDDDEKLPDITIVGDTGASTMRLIEEIGGEQGVKPPPRVADNIGRAPDILGHYGCAWNVDIPAFKRFTDNPDDSSVAAWVIEAPYAHPIWHSYMMALIHLRPIEGRPSPLIHLEGATHEFLLFALDPNAKRGPFVRGEDNPPLLSPANFGAQIIHASDAEAMVAMESVVVDIIEAKLSPDTDFFPLWVRRFGDNMVRRVAAAGDTGAGAAKLN